MARRRKGQDGTPSAKQGAWANWAVFVFAETVIDLMGLHQNCDRPRRNTAGTLL